MTIVNKSFQAKGYSFPPEYTGSCDTNWGVHAKTPLALLKDDMLMLHTTYHCHIICPCWWQPDDHSYTATLKLAHPQQVCSCRGRSGYNKQWVCGFKEQPLLLYDYIWCCCFKMLKSQKLASCKALAFTGF